MTVVKTRTGEEAAVLNLQGRVFMPADLTIHSESRMRNSRKLPTHIKVIFVDMHAEATSEKVAMGWYLDGRVSAVVGTHTHITDRGRNDSARRHGISDGCRE